MNKTIILEKLNERSEGTLMKTLDIVFTDVSENTLTAEMPVDNRHKQPYGLLHGGATLALAETIGSSGSAMYINHDESFAVGIQVSGNHLRSVTEGKVIGTGTIVHKGRSTHLWEIHIKDDEGKLISTISMTNFIKPRNK